MEERTIPVTISAFPLSLINLRKYICRVRNDKSAVADVIQITLGASAKGFVAIVCWDTQRTLKAQCISFIFKYIFVSAQ